MFFVLPKMTLQRNSDIQISEKDSQHRVIKVFNFFVGLLAKKAPANPNVSEIKD